MFLRFDFLISIHSPKPFYFLFLFLLRQSEIIPRIGVALLMHDVNKYVDKQKVILADADDDFLNQSTDNAVFPGFAFRMA